MSQSPVTGASTCSPRPVCAVTNENTLRPAPSATAPPITTA